MSEHLLNVFAKCKAQSRPAFVAYLTAGFPQANSTVSLLLTLEASGADIIEIGMSAYPL
jgi:tryptophan synthase